LPSSDGTARLSDPEVRLAAALSRRYTVQRELGRGGMGTVYLALDRKHGRQVAIKVLPPEVAAALGPERFLREIQIAARLSHPHILPLHDSGQAAGMLYYVMPHVDGESLRARLDRERQLPPDDAVQIARDVAAALTHAHAVGVVHRDVKPENILLAADHALLADFGVARAMGGTSPQDGKGTSWRITDSGLPIGTAAYASPEQAAGRRDVDGRSDIYSLGCVLFEMLVGEPPTGGPTSRDFLERRFSESLPPVRRYRPDAPVWIDQAIAAAVARDPADRVATAEQFRDALKPGSALSPQHGPPRPAPGLRQRRLLWMAAGAATLALVGTAVAFLPPRTVPVDRKRVVVAGFENRTGDSAFSPVSDIAADYIARGLATTGLMHEVFDARATARDAGQPAPAGAAGGLALAKRLGAGTVLWGSYYLNGDSLHFEAQLIDGTTGELIVPLQPSVGPAGEKTRVVEQLRQRVMAGLSVVLGTEFDSWRAGSLPPTYEAYQEMLAGRRSGFDFAGAARHYARAAALDTTFTGAQTAGAVAHWLAYNCVAVDSIAHRLEPKRHLLPVADRGQLDLATASCHEDPDAALDAVRTALQSVPRSRYFTILGSVIALEHLRPRESLEILKQLEVEKLGLGDDPLYHDWLGMTYHMLGDYRRELAASGARSALVGMGRVAEAELSALNALPATDVAAAPWPVPMDTECVALELRAHGHPKAAQRVLEAVIAWYGSRVNDATQDDTPCLHSHFNAFYYAGRWVEARAGYEHWLAVDSTSLKAHAALGALAVRLGDRAEVERMDAWLAALGANPYASYARSRIAALRGDKQRAVDLLRQAFEERLRYRMYLHLDPDFESLRDYPPYRELVRPQL
jgi:hypothetical protein